MFRLKSIFLPVALPKTLGFCRIWPSRPLTAVRNGEKGMMVTYDSKRFCSTRRGSRQKQPEDISQLCADIIFPSQKDQAYTCQEWAEIVEKLRNQGVISQKIERQLPCIVGNICRSNKYEKGMVSYVQYSRENVNAYQHLVVLQQYIGLLGLTCKGNREKQEQIFQVFEELNRQYDALDFPEKGRYTNYVIMGLAATDKWGYYLEKYLDGSLVWETSWELITPLIISAVSEEQYDIANKLINEIVNRDIAESDLNPGPLLFKGLLNLMHNLHKKKDDSNNPNKEAVKQSEKVLRFLLQHMQQHMWYLPTDCIEDLKMWFEEHHLSGSSDPQWQGKWLGTLVTMNTKKIAECPSCKRHITEEMLFEEDYNRLFTSLSSNIGDRADFKPFCEFLENIGPVDLVVDTMNLFHRILLPELLHRNYDFKNILLIDARDRFYQKRLYQKRLDPRIKIWNCSMEAKSEVDDMLLMLAAMKKRCLFLTRDHLLTHIKRVQNKRLFLRWKFLHQCTHDKTRRGGFQISYMWKVIPYPHVETDHIHIPAIDFRGLRVDEHLNKFQWLCLRKT